MTRRSHFAPSSWRGTHSPATSKRKLTVQGSRKRFDWRRAWPFLALSASVADTALTLNAIECIERGEQIPGGIALAFAAVIGFAAVFAIVRAVVANQEPPPLAEIDPVIADLQRQVVVMERRRKARSPLYDQLKARTTAHLARGR